MKKLTRMAAALAAGVLIAGVSACGGSSGSSAGSAEEISLWYPADSGQIEAYVKEYNSSQDEYTVKARAIPFANYDTSLNQAFSAGTGPDIAQINSSSFATFADKGFLQPITPIAGTDGAVAESTFYPNLYSVGQYDGEQLALPVDTGTRVLQWNSTLFEKAGVQPFGATVSWEEMLTAAQKIKALGGEYQGYCYVGGDRAYATYAGVGAYVGQDGGAFVNDDATKATLNTPEFTKAVEFMAQLAQTGDASNAVSTSSAACTEALGKGTVGMYMDGWWGEPTAEQIDTSATTIQRSLSEDTTVYSTTGGWLMGVPNYVKKDKYPALKAFMGSMFETENLVKFTGLMPAKIDSRAQSSVSGSQYDVYWNVLEENAGHPIPLNPGLQDQMLITMNLMQQVIQGSKPADEAIEAAQTEFQDTLSK